MLENALFSKKQKIKRFYIFSLLIGVLFSPAALANQTVVATDDLTQQQVDDASKLSTEDYTSSSRDVVTVIGSRLPSFQVPFADIPANVSYIPANATRKDKEEIYITHPRKLQDNFKDLEGAVLYDEVGNGVDTTFSLRGFNDSSSVIVLVDGVRVNKVDGNAVDYPLLSSSDLEAVQVDRGSASPIFGTNAFAGVVHITTGRPSEEPFSLFGGLEFSSFNGVRFHNGISGTLQDEITPLGGEFKYYFKAGRNLNRGFRDNGEYRITDFDIKTEYHLPEEGGRFFVHVKHVDDGISNPGAITFQQFQDDDAVTNTDLDGRYRESTTISIGADKSFFDNKVIASILTSARYNDTDFWTTFQTFADTSNRAAPNQNLVEVQDRATDFIWQLAYQDEWDAIRNQTVLGMEMRDASNDSSQRDAFFGFIDGGPLEADRTSKIKNVGIFWRETLNFNNVVIIHAGMRHDYHWLESLNQLTNVESNERWRDSTLSTGITIRPIESADLFFNYSQGFRVPTISEISPFAAAVSSNLRPEKSDSYEVGARLRIKDKAQAKASFFVIDLKDEILFDTSTITVGNPFGANTNAGETRRVGLETRLDANPIDEVSMYGSYTWTQAWIRETENNAFGGTNDGRSLGLIPEHRFTVGLTARPLKRLGEKFEGLKVGMYGTFTGKQHPANYESNGQALLNATGGAGHFIKPYSVWDLILSYELNGVELYFKVNNLFDEKYYSRSINATVFGGFFAPVGPLAPGSYNFVNPGAGREIVFGSRWEFDQLADLFGSAKS